MASQAYEPCTQDVHCPECGLHIPTGSCCLVGSSDQGDLDGAQSQGWVRLVRSGSGIVLLTNGALLVTMLVVAMFTGSFPGFGRGSSATILGLSWELVTILPATILVVGAAIVHLRRRMLQGSLDPEGSRGGADFRVLVQPGALRIFRNSQQDPPIECAAADVRTIKALSQWQFMASAHSASVMVMHFEVPTRGLVSFSVLAGYFLVPAGVMPMDIARKFRAVLEGTPDAAIPLPVAVTAPTRSGDPKCPLCGASLADVAHARGRWALPLDGDVACARCPFTAPLGSYVLTGERGFGQGARLRMNRTVSMALARFGAFALVGVALTALGFWLHFLVGVVLLVFLVTVLAGQMATVIRVSRAHSFLRPEGRFQPGEVAWVVSPGQLTIIEQGRFDIKRRMRVVPAQGVSRVEFASLELDGSSVVNADLLIVRGLASALGVQCERFLALGVYAGLDRQQFAQELTRTLRRSPAFAPDEPA